MLFECWMCTWDDRLWPFVVFKGNVHRLERPVVATEKIGEEECIPFQPWIQLVKHYLKFNMKPENDTFENRSPFSGLHFQVDFAVNTRNTSKIAPEKWQRRRLWRDWQDGVRA